MATVQITPNPGAPSLGSYQTALCIIPPAHLHPKIDSLRELYDKAHDRWPPHVNLVYPFVPIEHQPQAIDLITSNLHELGLDCQKINLQLDVSDSFSHRHSNTVFIAPSHNSGEGLKALQSGILKGFKGSEDAREYRPHLTIGQTPVNTAPMLEYLLGKAKLLLPIDWQVEELVLLVRERMPEKSKTESRMKVWGSITLSQKELAISGPLRLEDRDFDGQERSPWSDHVGQNMHSYGARKILSASPRSTYRFTPEIATWKPVHPSLFPMPNPELLSTTLKLSSYNVLHDPKLTLSTEERYPTLLKTILSESAQSDILILQEVSDDFLSYILNNDAICSNYSFATHAPVNPLPSLRNIVVFSRWNFIWEHLPFEQRHKGAVILQLSPVGTSNSEGWKPLIVVGVHLSSGLSDSGVVARMSQLQALIAHLSKKYPTNPWIVAGDFNIATSNAAIDEAVEMKSISAESAKISDAFAPMLEKAGLIDVWATAGCESGDGVFDGDEGATFDPLKNPLAAETVRNAGSKNMRPRRYDRIFIKGDYLLEIVDFNKFGFQDVESDKITPTDKIDVKGKDRYITPRCGSDHYGIRATLNIGPNASADMETPGSIKAQHSEIKIIAAPLSLSSPNTLQTCLTTQSVFPSEVEIQHRMEVLALLGTIFQDSASESKLTHDLITLVPVGSYALETYLRTSDIDILALGSLTASSFFTHAVRRLQDHKKSGVKILRRVDATTGTMLELEIRDVRCDLQYCCAPGVVSRWHQISDIEPTDPIFQLPIQALQKLNSYRDIEHIKRSIPASQMREFQLAHRYLHVWARGRGVYAGKFGFLNGFAITLMLFRILKSLHSNDAVAAPTLICTFFNHYSGFDWREGIVFDPAFSVDKKRYRRSARDVMVVLSLHAPRVNVMRAASLPALRTISEELRRAERLLEQSEASWESVICDDGVAEFLRAYKSYVKIDVSYWGSSTAEASSLLGWLESKCVVLLVDLSRKLPNIHARIWPARFALREDGAKQRTNDEYQGCYLIGLRKIETVQERSMGDSDRKLAQNTLRTSLESFADQIRGDEKYFDPSTSWVDVSHIKQSDLGDQELDTREWRAHADGVYQSDADENDRTEDAVVRIVFSNDTDDEEAEPLVSQVRSKMTATSKGTKANTQPVSSNKLRPASDILSRLRWDPDLDSTDYVVGYIDRFLGTKEQGLETWKSEQTDEEFIPQHRIVYFRRKSDDVRVWDRETRLDLIFGSGIGNGYL